MAQQESFDPKPYAPLEYRGPMNSIPTKIAGERIGEMFKRTAQVTDKMTIIRSMTHGEAAHERGTHNMFTGYRPSPALQYPSMVATKTKGHNSSLSLINRQYWAGNCLLTSLTNNLGDVGHRRAG